MSERGELLTLLVYDRGSWWETPPGSREPRELTIAEVLAKLPDGGGIGTSEPRSGDGEDIAVRLLGPVVLRCASDGLTAWNHHMDLAHALDATDVGILTEPEPAMTVGVQVISGVSPIRIDALEACALVEKLDRFHLHAEPDSVGQVTDTPTEHHDQVRDKDVALVGGAPHDPVRGQAAVMSDRRPRVLASWDITAHGMPLALGGLLAFARVWKEGHLGGIYDIQRVMDHAELLEELRRDPAPAVLLLSNYFWSEEANLAVARQVKDLDAEHLVIVGGPYVPNDRSEAQRHLALHPWIDVLVHGEGEITLVESLYELGGDTRLLSALSAVPGLTIRTQDGLVRTRDRPLHQDLGDFPSPYVSGEFDHLERSKLPKLLGELEIPGIETDRGCPYECSFCISGVEGVARLRKFPMQRVLGELEWCAKRDIGTFFIIDANFGIHPRDVEIARAMVHLREQYGVPRTLGASYAKHAAGRVAMIVHLLTSAGITAAGSLALQTRDAQTLDNVKRSNIRPEIYDELAEKFRNDGLPLFTDIMIGLPGQTVQTVLADFQYCIDQHLTPRLFPAVCVRNTEMSRPEYREKFGIVTGRRDIVLETSSFTVADHERMMRLRMAFRCFEHFGILRHLLRYVQWDLGIDASEQLDRIERVVHSCPNDYPLLSWVLGYLDIFLVTPFAWKSFYDEIGRLLQQEFGIEPHSALSTVFEVQIALMPARMRRFPDIRVLDHDYLTWYLQHVDHDVEASLTTLPRLGDLCSGTLEVGGDPRDRCGIAMYRLVDERSPEDVLSLFWAGLHWELDSPLERVLDLATPATDIAVDNSAGTHMTDTGDSVPTSISQRATAPETESGTAPRVGELPGWGPWRSGDRPSGPDGFGEDAVDRTVGERFFDMAERYRENVAVTSPSGVWTYEDLARRVAAIAGGIQHRVGGQTGVPVAVIADHDGPLVALILGVISAGGVVVVLDPSAPTPQTEAVLSEASPVLLIADDAHQQTAVSLAAGVGCEQVNVADLNGDFDGPQPLGWRAPAMLAFTSGTTGVSKAAVVNHGVLLNVVRGATDISGIGPDDRMAMLFPASLVVAAYPIFIPLLNGGRLATFDVRSEGLAPLADFLIRERITFAYLAPTVVRFLGDSVRGRSFPDLRIMGIGGELIDREILELTCDLFGCEHVAVAYGTTETGVISIAIYDRNELPEGDVSCGYPVAGVEFRILDDSGAPLDAGEAGEIAVVSDRLFDGYWGHPELDRLVLSDDGSESSGRRIYRTGDRGCLDINGGLTVLGRDDMKVKIRGRFVVLGDVEADLRELDGIADAAVACRRLGGVPELVGYVVPEDGRPAEPRIWRASLLDRREAYRVPSRWVVLDELPLLPNGKMDRRLLPELAGNDRVSSSVGGSHSTHTIDCDLRLVRTIWEELFTGTLVGLDDDFGELGGDSLLAAQMLVMLQERTDVVIPMGDLVHARTVRQLAEILRDRRAPQTSSAVSTVSCVQSGDESAHPLLWFVHDLHGSAYRVRHVAAELGNDWPVWSFESPLLAGERNPHRFMDTFAARYVTDMREVQPHGPYWLAGYSFGGFCAYEMARQLVSSGEEVAFLGVIDIGPGLGGAIRRGRRSPLRPWFGVAPPPPDGSGVGESLMHYRRMISEGPLRVGRHLIVRSGASRLIDPVRFEIDLRRRGRVRPAWRLWYSWEEHWKLMVDGWDRSSTYPGRLDLFWAHGSPSDDASMGWEPRVQELHIHRFDGYHNCVFEPRGAPIVAERLRAVLDEKEMNVSA